jgi:hypothetical protein
MATLEPEAHDLLRVTDILRQCLAQDKRPLAVLLGAGCPVAIEVVTDAGSKALIPDVAGVTAAILERLSASDLAASLSELVTGLDDDLRREVTVEDWLTRLRSLATVAGTSTVRGLTAENIDALESAITDEIFALVSVALPSDRNAYDALAAWVGSADRAHPLNVFTTNYDLLAEQALEQHGVAYFDGFVGSREPFLDTRAMEDDALPNRWARLWKLHGSVNWARLADGRVVRRAPSPDERRLIHPSHLKYDESRRMPYLAMHDRFRALLKRSSATLLTVGYSFRDEHINELIVEGLHGNSSAMTFALLYDELDNYSAATALATRCSNLTLLAADAACIGTRIAPWARPNSADQPTRSRLGNFAGLAELLGQLTGHSDGAEAALA